MIYQVMIARALCFILDLMNNHILFLLLEEWKNCKNITNVYLSAVELDKVKNIADFTCKCLITEMFS